MEMPNFKQRLEGFFGIEVEWGLFQCGLPAPLSPWFIELQEQENGKWVMELPAWQVEYTTPPCSGVGEIKDHLTSAKEHGSSIAEDLNAQMVACEVAPAHDLSYVTSPKPVYDRIVAKRPEKRWHSGCRVAGTHIHYGCRSLAHALEVHNRLVENVEHFCQIGEHQPKQGKSRLELYREMAGDCDPPQYGSAQEWIQRAKTEGFVDSLGSCHDLIRISSHGTVEVRCFGITLDVDEILWWVREVQQIIEGG